MKSNLIERTQEEENLPIAKTEGDHMNPLQETDNYEEEEWDIDEKKIVYTLMYTILVAECGDRSQISSILLATVYNFSGVMLGTTVALICTILIAVFLGAFISKYISEKSLNYVAAGIFLGFGLEILLTKASYF